MRDSIKNIFKTLFAIFKFCRFMILFIFSKEENLLSKILFSAHRYLLYEEWLGISN